MTNIEPTRAQRVITWLAIMAATALIVGVTVFMVHPSRAGDTEKWKIVAQLTGPDGQAVRLTYGSQQTGAVYFPSEAACKAEIADKKSKFHVEVWDKLAVQIKQANGKVDSLSCVMDLDVPKPKEPSA
jgi:hypothetical protein